jgi:predicted dehydrogenase
MSNFYSRRQFLHNSSKMLAGASLLSLPVAEVMAARSAKKIAASDKVNIALIGGHSMGWANLSSHLKLPDVNCVALCDVDNSVLNGRAAEVEKITGKKPVLFTDYRQLLAHPDLDAVIIGTPDHWHALMMIDAAQAGKDVYVEKPIANSIEECNAMVAAAKRYNRVVQVGQWQRSGQHWQDAVKYVQSGKLGTIRLVKVWAYMPYGRNLPVVADSPVPAGVDYDKWLGPAPKRPFNKNRFHGSFRYFWDYAGGLMTDWGVHMIDIALMGMNVSTPKSITSAGGRFGFPDNAGETPDTMQTVYEFDGFTMLWEQGLGIARGPYDKEHGVAFIGNNGTLVVDRGRWEVFPQIENGAYLMEAMPPQNSKDNALDKHTRNFIDCIKSRGKTNTDIVAGRNAALNAQFGNISYKLGRKIYWDESKNLFRQDKNANQLAQANLHNGWKLPKA